MRRIFSFILASASLMYLILLIMLAEFSLIALPPAWVKFGTLFGGLALVPALIVFARTRTPYYRGLSILCLISFALAASWAVVRYEAGFPTTVTHIFGAIAGLCLLAAQQRLTSRWLAHESVAPASTLKQGFMFLAANGLVAVTLLSFLLMISGIGFS